MSKRGNNEGSIYKLADGRWASALTLDEGGRRRRKVFTARTRTEVSRRLDAARRTIAAGLPLADERLTVAVFLRRWLLESAKPTVRPRTFESYRQTVEGHLLPALGHLRLARLSPDDVNSYMVTKLGEKLSPRSVQYHHAVLRRGLEQATRWGHVARNVAKLVTPPRVERPEVTPLTVEQTRRFLQVTAGTRLGTLFAVAAGLGMRQSETLGLRWSDVDLKEGLITIQRSLQRYGNAYHLDDVKTARSRRTLSLSAPLSVALKEQRTRQLEERLAAGPSWEGEGWGLVFATPTGGPLSGRQVTAAFKRALKLAGLPDARFHDLRHGAASFALAQGVSMKVVQELLGHSTIATTANVYAHLTRELQQDASDRVAALLWAERA